MDHNQIDELKNQARSKAREILSQSASFHGLEKADQFSLYKDVVESEYQSLAQKNGLIPANGRNEATLSEAKSKEPVSRLANIKEANINDDRYRNTELDKAGQRAGDFIQQVDFPKFVRDLLKGVFDANLEVTTTQMQEYQAMLKEATKSVGEFAKMVGKADSFAYLAENNNDEFGLSFEEDDDGNETMVLTDKGGNPVDTEDTKIKRQITDAQIAIAQERRALLRETILMGISRLVIERGTVKAGVEFKISSQSKVKKSDRADNRQKGASVHVDQKSSGFLFWRRPKSNTTTKERKTSISISTAKGSQTDSLAAKVTGEVEIVFKSDYFKLDNFADMYSGGKVDSQAKS